jgi:rhodanese-related sulfurtransferase
MAKQNGRGFGWLGGYVLGFISVALIFYVVWQLSARQQPSPPTALGQVAPPALADDHDHAALEAEIAKVPRVTAEELKELMDRGEAVAIDVRAVNDYADGHLPGALQIPLSFVEGEIPWFPRDKKLVPYCSCPAEETSGQAVLILQKGGLTNSAALVGGIDTWRARGYPIETGMPEKVE